jgi:hypothetical protein
MAQTKQGRWVTDADESTSSALKLVTETLVGFYTPAALDAAKLKFQASHDGENFVDIVSEGSALTVDVDVDQYIALDATKFLGPAHVRVVHLDSGGDAVDESAERVLLPIFRTFE